MSFDMSKVKEGDKLVTRNGKIVCVKLFDIGLTNIPYLLSNGIWYYPDGRDCTGEGDDVVGFADENQQANCSFTEMQAVELLLSLGYTLKKE